MKRPFIASLFFIICAAIGAFAAPAYAARLTFVSDTITDSRPVWLANHTIVFNVTSGVPAQGKIKIAFENNPFSIDPSFSYADVDFAVSAVSPYNGFVDRPLAAAADAVNDGVAVDAANGIITITLASGSNIPAASYVRIMLGTNASFDSAGTFQITNPSSTASYRILLNTLTGASAAVDNGAAMVAILPAVGVDVNENKITPAILSNGLPTGTIPSNVSAVLISFNTDVFSTCRYATSSGVSYDAMTNEVSHTALGIFHTATISGITENVTYNIYIRCVDFAGNKNSSDYLISFTAGQPTGTGQGGGTGGGSAASPGGGGAGFTGDPYPPGPGSPALVLRGVAAPNISITVLQDGKQLSLGTKADSNGNFSVSIPTLNQGTYSFTLLENDSSGRIIASYTTTLTVILGTTNSVTNILLPPGVSIATSTIAPGGTVIASGVAAPSSTIELWVTSQSNLQDVIKLTTVAGPSGAWEYSLSTAGYSVDTYQLKARATLPGYTASSFSNISYLGVGTAPKPKGQNGDLNGDGKVNLVDFSVLLFHWGTNYPASDLNGDGTVNLIDFSILLFNWTG